jgi:hypothetical protein
MLLLLLMMLMILDTLSSAAVLAVHALPALPGVLREEESPFPFSRWAWRALRQGFEKTQGVLPGVCAQHAEMIEQLSQ